MKKKSLKQVLFTLVSDELYDEQECDEGYYVLLAEINKDPKNYREAMSTEERTEWKEAINKELNELKDKKVFKVVNRPILDTRGKRPNIIDSRWIFKTKAEGNLKKARIVIRGFKDINFYNLRETYAPVSRIGIIRALLAYANKYKLPMIQMDVDIAFLYSPLKEEIYMEIPDGVDMSKEEKEKKVWLLEKSLYGLKTSPKNWNKTFTQVAIKLGFKASKQDPCVFVYEERNTFIILTLYVDDIIEIGNN